MPEDTTKIHGPFWPQIAQTGQILAMGPDDRSEASEATSAALRALMNKQTALVSKQNQRVRLQQQVRQAIALTARAGPP